MNKIPFENGTLITPAKVNEDNTITPAIYEGTTPLTAHNLNLLQDNVESEIINSGVVVNSTEPTEKYRSKVWLQKSKNLLNFSSFGTKTINGVTFTNNGNGTITINGNASASFGVNFVKFNLGAGTYHLSVNANTSQNFYIYDYDTNTNILSKEATATLTKDYNNIGFDTYINNGQVFDNLIISPQLEVGSSASVFEENVTSAIYTKESNNKYEKFSETVAISSTQPINETGIWLQKGKNLFDKNNFIMVNYQTAGATLTYDANCETFVLPIEPLQTYTISRVTLGARFGVGFTEEYPTSGATIINRTQNNTATSLTITSSSTSKYLIVWYYHKSYDTDKQAILDGLMVEKGSTATDYEEYIDKKIYVKNANGVYEEFINADEVKPIQITTGVEYATNEYLDGKRVYKKRIKIGTLPSASATPVQVDTGISVSCDIVDTNGIAKNTDGTGAIPLMYNNNSLIMYYYITSNGQSNYQVFVYTTGDRSSYTGYITIYYTKTDVATTSLDAE